MDIHSGRIYTTEDEIASAKERGEALVMAESKEILEGLWQRLQQRECNPWPKASNRA